MSINDFEFVKFIGEGAFSRVFLVQSKFDNKFYAMKIFDKKFILENDY